MRNVFLIARREYLEQIRSRAFKLSTIGLPAALAIIFGISYLSSLGLGANKHMAIAASDAALASDLRTRLTSEKNSKAVVDVVAPAKPEDRALLTEQVRTKAIDGLLWIETPAGGVPEATYISQSAGDFMSTARLKGALDDSLVSEHLTGAGMNQAEADALLKGTSIQSYQVKKDGQLVKSNAMASFWKGYAMALLLTMTTMIYGLNVARSIIQEKTSRVFEVMLATVKPSDMLAGKLAGAGAVGLTQIGIWLVAGGAILSLSPRRGCDYWRLRHPFFVGRVRAVSGVLPAGLPAFQCAVCGPRRHLRDRAGAADVHAAGGCAHLAELRHDPAHHQRLEFVLVGCGLVLSAYRAHRHVSAHGLTGAAGLAVCRLHRPHGAGHLGHAVVLFAPLPGRDSDVWQAGHTAGTAALAAV